MPEKIPLKIYDIVGGPVWVSTTDGQKVYEKIVAAFKAGRAVELSFANRGNLITAFLNAAVGQLYNGEFTEDFLRENLTAVDITEEDRVMLGRAVDNAKRYFANQGRYDAAWKEEMGNEEE
jgi:hypothetical protein